MDDTSYVLEVGNKKYNIEIISIKIRETKAYYAEYYLDNSPNAQIFNDTNGMPYYFTNIAFLKEILKSKLE